MNAALSRLQAKVAPASLAVKAKLTAAPLPGAGEVIVVSGAVLSTVTETLLDVAAFPAASTARALTAAGPSATSFESQATP